MTQLLHYFFRSHLQVLSVLVLLLSQRLSAQVLIAGTEFDPLPGYEDSTYFDLNGVKQYGLQTGALSINRPFATSANANIFHGTPQYAISNNPANLDNVRYMDTPASTDYQLILSPGTTTPSNVLHYKVFGLKPGSKVTVDVSYCNIMSTTNATCNEQYGIKGIINPDAANINNGSNSPQVAEGACGTFTFTMQGTEVIGANGEANFYLNLDKAGTCTPLGIKKVEVFGTPNPQIISAQGLEVCAGEQITIQPKQYYDANYQWFLNGNPISGATNPTLLHSVLTTGDYEFTLRITPKTSGATSVTSEKLTVKAITCCGEEGKPASRTTIFQDNFGRLDMTDKTGGHYYAWDYTTDRLNPKEVRKATDNPFRWKLDPAPLNATYKATGAPEDGQYVVAAVLGSGDVSGVTGGYVGAQLSWANKILGPTNIPNPDIATDHSEKIDGGVLLLNVPQNSVDKSLYTREFTGLCDKQLYFEAWIAVFTNSPADASAPYNPVKIKVRLTDMLSNASEESA
ncbi:MAG TPA: hypothetical protein VL947_08345, partial [Cytophagales bacterium]|nr:hypothetical protein [Cytophagales bacterium]